MRHFSLVCEKRSEMLRFVPFVVTCIAIFVASTDHYLFRVFLLIQEKQMLIQSFSYKEYEETVVSLLSR
jgi:hypothetical protein